jgi:hypothetical protein
MHPKDSKLWMCKGDFHVELASEAAATGDAATQTNQLREAINSFRGGCDVSAPSHRPAFRNKICRAFLQRGETDNAVREAQLGVQDNPRFVQNWMSLAMACLSAKRWPEAIEAADKGRDIGGASGKVWCLFFKVLALGCQGHTPQQLQPLVVQLEQERAKNRSFDSSDLDWTTARQTVETVVQQSASPQTAELIRQWCSRF